MKKSDLIKKLVPLYADHVEKNGCVIVDILMKEIIGKAVEAGMLPPGIYVPCGPYETVEYIWESENEKK